jgi:hypothetical protein
MTILWNILILAAMPAAPDAGHDPAAREVFSCRFDDSVDVNYDGWPDQWTRQRGLGFPRHLPVTIVPDKAPGGGRCLKMELDGGSAVAFSPPAHVSSLYDYLVEAQVRAEGLRGAKVWLSLSLWDKDQKCLETFDSPSLGNTDGWKRLRLGPVSPRQGEAVSAVVGLHVEGDRDGGEWLYLKGSARFADVWLARLPRISLSMGRSLRMFTVGEPVPVVCNASGLKDGDTNVTLRLLDVDGKEMAATRQKLEINGMGQSTDSVQDVDKLPVSGRAKWQPPIPGAGFYRVEAALTVEGAPLVRSTALAVVEPRRATPGSEFGWTLPRADRPLGIPDLVSLICQSGVGWVKYPLWCEREDAQRRLKGLVRLTEAMSAQQIELVGLLDLPPAEVRTKLDCPARPTAAEVFTSSPKIWYPSIESVLLEMSTLVRWWQLGNDSDTSFVGHPALADKLARLKKDLKGSGQDVGLGFGWDWVWELPQESGDVPWQFLTLSSSPAMTAQELARALDAARKLPARRWVVMEPLRRSDYSLPVRTADLVQRMATAKIHGADGIFMPDPFGDDRGLLDDDGTPGELFLPWRTTALLLGGTQHLGHVDLPGGSRNEIFAQEKETVMVVWSDEPAKESLFLGVNARRVDPWGRSVRLPVEHQAQTVEVGPVPVFLAGIDPEIARWRQSLLMVKDRLPSLLEYPQPNKLRITNPTNRGMAGRVKLGLPQGWQAQPSEFSFRLSAGETV